MKRRDNLKVRYCQEEGISLVTINYDEEITTPAEIIEKVNIALNS